MNTASLSDHLVGARDYAWRNAQAERVGSLEVLILISTTVIYSTHPTPTTPQRQWINRSKSF
jgi:hypothetical protein